jgi:hypothetical protein
MKSLRYSHFLGSSTERITLYIFVCMCVCVYFNVDLLFFYFHDYIAEMLYVIADKKYTEKSFMKSYTTYNRSAGHAIRRLLCNPQLIDVETTCHRSLPSAKQIRSVPVIYLISTLMLSSNLRLGITSSLYPSSLLTALFFAFASSLARTAHPMFIDFIS